MNPEYRELIEKNLALLNSAMDWEHTGGGCDAFVLNTANNKYFLLTVEDEAIIPTTPQEWDSVAVGLYNEESELLGDVFTGSLDEVVKLFGGK